MFLSKPRQRVNRSLSSELLCISLNYSGMLPSDWWYSQAIYPWKEITMQYEATSRNFMWGQAGHQFLCVCVCATRCCAKHEKRSCIMAFGFQDVFVTISFTVQSDWFSTGPKYLFYHPLTIERWLALDRWWHLNTKALKKIWSDACTRTEGWSLLLAHVYWYIYIVFTQHIDSKICGLWLIGS